MSDFPPRSPAAKLRGIVYVGRMIDKIRLHAAGKLPADYEVNLGRGFDANCATFLQIDYDKLAEHVRNEGADEEIIGWCFANGREPRADEIEVWNGSMAKRGWRDEINEFLTRRKKEAGYEDRAEIETMFEFIDADEGR